MDLFKSLRSGLLIRSILAVLFGIIAMAWPVGTAVTLVIMWGIYALVDGVAFLGLGFSLPAGRALNLIMGALGIVAGLIAIFRPISSMVALAWVMGIWLIARGIVEVIGAFSDDDQGNSKWMLALSGVLAVLAGMLFVAYPGEAAVSMALWLGMLVFFFGVFGIVSYFMTKKVAS